MIYGLVVANSKSRIVEEVSKALPKIFDWVLNAPLLMLIICRKLTLLLLVSS